MDWIYRWEIGMFIGLSVLMMILIWLAGSYLPKRISQNIRLLKIHWGIILDRAPLLATYRGTFKDIIKFLDPNIPSYDEWVYLNRSVSSAKRLKLISNVSIIIVLAVFSLYALNLGVNSYRIKMERKSRQLVMLNGKLTDKVSEIEELKRDYQAKIEKSKEEIRQIKKQEKITTFEMAQGNTRIAYDLNMIQREQAYIVKLDEIQKNLLLGQSELMFLYRQVQDDLAMANVLGKEESKKLISNINAVIHNYLPQAGELAINVETDKFQPLDKIWEEIK